MKFEERLKLAIQTKGISQRKLSQIIGSSPKAVTSWLLGRQMPSGCYIKDICEALDISADWLFDVSKGDNND